MTPHDHGNGPTALKWDSELALAKAAIEKSKATLEESRQLLRKLRQSRQFLKHEIEKSKITLAESEQTVEKGRELISLIKGEMPMLGDTAGEGIVQFSLLRSAPK